MSLMNNFLRSDADQGNYCQIFDNNYTCLLYTSRCV